MDRILDYARSRGIAEVWGHVLSENEGMLGLAHRLGFKAAQAPGEPGVSRVTKSLV